MSVLSNVLGLFLIATPFLIGYAIFSLLSPSGFWEGFATFILVLIVCIPEGFIAWCIGLIILDE